MICFSLITVEQCAHDKALGGAVNGCKCPECFGLAEYMRQITGDDHGLPKAKGHAPALDLIESRCEGTMTCQCPECVEQRRERMRRRPAAQPWEAKRAA